MEYKIGQIFEIDGIWYQFVEGNRGICKGCVFYQSKIKCTNPDEDVKCSKWHREDGKDGHFVRLLPIGDVYEQGGARWQQYKCIEKPNTEDRRVYITHTDSDIGLIVSIRLTSSSDMERKIGEIFEYNGEWYQCVNQNGCCNCAFYNSPCFSIDELSCDSLNKKRKERYIFKKLEKVGEPIIYMSRTFQRLKSPDAEQCKYCYFRNQVCNPQLCGKESFLVEIKQTKEDMEENNNAKHSNSENIGKNLKEFNLEAAKSGKPVCTRDGRKARIICFDQKDIAPIVGLVTGLDGKESIYAFYKDGRVSSQEERVDDLMMLPEKKEGWVNIDKGGSGKIAISSPYSTKEEAIYNDNETTIDTIKISWEE